MATNFGKKFYIEDLADLLELPEYDSVEEINEHGVLWEAYKVARDDALFEGKTEDEAEEAGVDAESFAREELFVTWRNAIEEAARQLLEEHGLELQEVNLGTYKIAPEQSWRDAAGHIVETINGVGYFYFGNVKEFLDSGPYTPKQAVVSHLHWIKDRPEVYGTSSAATLYQHAWR